MREQLRASVPAQRQSVKVYMFNVLNSSTAYVAGLDISLPGTSNYLKGTYRKGITGICANSLKGQRAHTPSCGNALHAITKTRIFKYIKKKIRTKNRKFSNKKKSDIFHIPAQNIDCGYSLEPPWRGGSNEYQQSMFLSRNEKKMYTPINPFLLYNSRV